MSRVSTEHTLVTDVFPGLRNRFSALCRTRIYRKLQRNDNTLVRLLVRCQKVLDISKESLFHSDSRLHNRAQTINKCKPINNWYLYFTLSAYNTINKAYVSMELYIFTQKPWKLVAGYFILLFIRWVVFFVHTVKILIEQREQSGRFAVMWLHPLAYFHGFWNLSIDQKSW